MVVLGISAPPGRTGKSARPTLDRAEPGARVRIVKLACGARCAAMLFERGVRPGETLSVRHRAPMGGPVWVELAGAMFAIGRGIARKIVIAEVAAGD